MTGNSERHGIRRQELRTKGGKVSGKREVREGNGKEG